MPEAALAPAGMGETRPPFKWAGGKSRLLPWIRRLVPPRVKLYVEPFLGAGAVMLDIADRAESILASDINPDLINVWRVLKDRHLALDGMLEACEREWAGLDMEERRAVYMNRRDWFNTSGSNEVTRAALFLFLNKTCFNGLFRVNRSGLFNTPPGKPSGKGVLTFKSPRYGDRLKAARFEVADFRLTMPFADDPEAFIYLDPPYRDAFTCYDPKRFGDDDHRLLRRFLEGRAKVLLSEKETGDGFFDDLARDFHVTRVPLRHHINPAKGAGEAVELLIRNFEPAPRGLLSLDSADTEAVAQEGRPCSC